MPKTLSKEIQAATEFIPNLVKDLGFSKEEVEAKKDQR